MRIRRRVADVGSMSKLIYGILPRDSVTFAASSAVLVVIAMAASLLPLTAFRSSIPPCC